MTTTITAPRLNNNDDTLLVNQVHITVGDYVKEGQRVLTLESDKVATDVEAEQSGYVIKCACQAGERVTVGANIIWLANDPHQTVPDVVIQPSAAKTSSITLKAKKILREVGLTEQDLPPYQGQLTEEKLHQLMQIETLTEKENGLLKTVSWQKQHAIPSYCEYLIDHQAWQHYATEYAKQHNLLIDPLLGLLAYRLVQVVKDKPELNAFIHQRYKIFHPDIHLGFTITNQSGLFLLVIKQAQRLSCADFLDQLMELQRASLAGRLTSQDLFGSTLSFSSMMNMGVSRHTPILPPRNALIVAHAVASMPPSLSCQPAQATLGASYDHRCLDGVTVAKVLKQLITPE